MVALTTFFSSGSIARRGELRGDSAHLDAAFRNAETGFVAISDSRCLVRDSAAVFLSRDQLGPDWYPSQGIYLGQRDGRELFAIQLPTDLGNRGPGEAAFANFRGLLSELDADDAALLAYAKGMVEWHARHRHCGRCGAANVSLDGGFVLACSNDACKTRCFPRLDPAIIVLVTDSDRCLLGRQASWPEGRFSTIAGFMEPGESLEDAVRREVLEETNVEVGEVIYMGSQPWPFPTALMVGFHAQATSTAIKRNDGELAEAGWFDREQVATGNIVLPPVTSIAFRLIEQWFNAWDGPPLTSLDLSGSFSRTTGERT